MEKEEHQALRVGLAPQPPPALRESQHVNKGNISLGTPGVPKGPLSMGSLTPLQGMGPWCSRAVSWEPGWNQGLRRGSQQIRVSEHAGAGCQPRNPRVHSAI